jgi:Domain of unknown function (DUF4329)
VAITATRRPRGTCLDNILRLLISSLVCVVGLAAPLCAQTADEIALIHKLFVKLQPLSIRHDREYCGHIGYDAKGVLRATEPFPGDASTCLPRDPVELADVVASYHTHAAFALDFHNELPSQQDVDGDAEQGMDGYVATPGGRLWFVDGKEQTVRQICPVNCLPTDPKFVFSDGGPVEKFYTYDRLVHRLDK